MAPTRPKDGREPLGLLGRVVVVSVAEPEAAIALAAAGATVVVIGDDATATGGLVRTLTDDGHRAIAFVGDVRTEVGALAEMVGELLPDRAPDTPEPA